MNNIGNDAANIGVITLDADATSLTIASANDDETAVTTFQEVSGSGLTSLTVTDAVADADAVVQIENVIDLDDTTALVTVDATGANGGVDLSIDGLGDNATINLLQADDEGNDAQDALTITFVSDTGADNLTITGGDSVETITITNGDLDDLTINSAGGNDVITVSGSRGDNMEINAGAGNDNITGNRDDNEINGGAGVDTITGGEGDDSIVGGAGIDTMVFAATAALNGTDTMSDFVNGTDVLNIDAFLNATAMNAALAADGAQTADSDVNLLIDIAGNQDITTAAGLNTAVAGGGEYASVDMGNNASAVFVTAASNAAGETQHVFFATSDGAGAITAVEVMQLSNLDINDFVAGDFNI